jgi:hypothetical protein
MRERQPAKPFTAGQYVSPENLNEPFTSAKTGSNAVKAF